VSLLLFLPPVDKSIPTTDVLSMIRLVLENNNFSFNGKHYLQVEGTDGVQKFNLVFRKFKFDFYSRVYRICQIMEFFQSNDQTIQRQLKNQYRMVWESELCEFVMIKRSMKRREVR
jgi:hypothetical protein